MAADDEPEVEYTPSGQPRYRYKAPAPFEFAVGSSETIEAVEAHITRHVGPVESVFHEIVSDKVHLDVHFVKAGDGRPCHVLVTSGMSDRPMTLPEGVDAPEYAELLICLPPDWKLSQEDFGDEANYWPVRWLKTLARLPHDYRTWLGAGHTVPNGDPPEPFADNTDLCGMLVLPPVRFGDDFPVLEAGGKRIGFYALIPLYADEMAFKLEHGTGDLLDRFDAAGVDEVVDIGRPSVCGPDD
jgi:hypothetical protein